MAMLLQPSRKMENFADPKTPRSTLRAWRTEKHSTRKSRAAPESQPRNRTEESKKPGLEDEQKNRRLEQNQKTQTEPDPPKKPLTPQASAYPAREASPSPLQRS